MKWPPLLLLLLPLTAPLLGRPAGAGCKLPNCFQLPWVGAEGIKETEPQRHAETAGPQFLGRHSGGNGPHAVGFVERLVRVNAL